MVECLTRDREAAGWSITSVTAMCPCFAIIVLQMYCYYKCSVALPHGAVDWPAVCDCGMS